MGSGDDDGDRMGPKKGRGAATTRKTVIKEADYKSGVRGVSWEKRHERWQAHWNANGKLCSTKFPVKEHGFEEAKRLAIECRQQAEATGRAEIGVVADHRCFVKRVYWDKTRSCWEAQWFEQGRKKRKQFSEREHGFDQAKQLAIDHRRAMEERFYAFR